MRFTTNIPFTKEIHKDPKPLSQNTQYLLVALAPAYFLFLGLILQPFPEVVQGLISIVLEPDFLITDYVVVGGVGAALVNASLTTLMCLGLMYILKMNIDGTSIARPFTDDGLRFIRKKHCQCLEYHFRRFYLRQISQNPFIQLSVYRILWDKLISNHHPDSPVGRFPAANPSPAQSSCGYCDWFCHAAAVRPSLQYA